MKTGKPKKPIAKTPAARVSAVKAPMAVEWWPIDKPVPYARNARKISARAVDKVAASIREFGWRQPIVVDRKGVVVVGHTRLMAGQKLDEKRVPVHVAKDLSEAQIKAYRLMDNRSHDESEWDMELVEPELLDLKALEYDLALTGFEQAQIQKLMAVEDPEEDNAPDVPAIPATVLGDVWLLGGHRVLCGDSTSIDAVERLMDGKKADMVFTDPPYGMHLDCDFSGIKGSLKSIGRAKGTKGNTYDNVIGDHDDFSPELINTIFAAFSYCKEIFLWGADYYADLLPDRNKGSWLTWDKRKESQAEAIGSEFELCWSRAKHKRRMLRHDWFGFLSSGNNSEARNRVHPTQKPTSLAADVLQQWGKEGDLVADLFLGSGSTLIACEKTQRSCYGMELAPAYVDVIVTRWQQFTGLEAVLDDDGRTFDAIKAARIGKNKAA